MQYTTEAYTQDTQRLDYDVHPIVTPQRRHDLGWAIIGCGVVLFLLLFLARLPQPAPFYDAPSYIYTDSRVCIGIAVCN